MYLPRIFLSATNKDLNGHLEAVMKAILVERLGKIPWHTQPPMDDRSPLETLPQVGLCDIYLCVVAHHYGAVPAGFNHSPTELEYREAKQCGKMWLLFLASESVPWPRAHVDSGEAHDHLSRFRIELMSHSPSEFDSDYNLVSLVKAALHPLQQLPTELIFRFRRAESPYVFLSYKNSNREQVEKVNLQLREAGINTWMDRQDLSPGLTFPGSIEKGIEECAAFVAFFSSKAIQDDGYFWVELKQAEQAAAYKRPGSPFLHIARLEPCDTRPWSRDRPMIDLFESDGLHRLINSILERLNHLSRKENELSGGQELLKGGQE